MTDVSPQVLDELKQRQLGNAEEEEKLQVKKKTVDLLPDAEDNLLKLQVGRTSNGAPPSSEALLNPLAPPLRLWWRAEPSGW